MQLAQIEAFLETTRKGNLSRAAEALFVSQPALTVRIHQLEEELGERLFVRTGRGVQLSDAGRAFLPYAERALLALHDGRELVAEMREGGAGELSLGAAPAVSTYVLPALLVRFTERLPRVRLAVRTGHSEEIVEMVLRNEVQLGLVRPIRHPLLAARPIYEDELVFVCAPSHPLAVASSVDLGQLHDQRLILFDRTSSYHELTQTLFREAGVPPRVVMELDNIEAAKKMVEEGLGVALLPATAVTAEVLRGSIRTIPIEGARPVRRPILAIRRRDAGPPTTAVAAFLELLGAVPEIVPGTAPVAGRDGERSG